MNNMEAMGGLAERLKCVPRMLAAKNLQLGRPLGDSDLEDVAQEIVLAVWRKRDTYNGHSTIETWVFPFCYHFLMNRVRKLRNRPRRVELDRTAPIAAPAKVDYGFVHGALDDLGPPEDVVLRLRQFEELSFVQIGEVLGISPNTAKSRYYRGLDRLRVILLNQGDQEES